MVAKHFGKWNKGSVSKQSISHVDAPTSRPFSRNWKQLEWQNCKGKWDINVMGLQQRNAFFQMLSIFKSETQNNVVQKKTFLDQ